jgi:hypothetical protein
MLLKRNFQKEYQFYTYAGWEHFLAQIFSKLLLQQRRCSCDILYISTKPELPPHFTANHVAVTTWEVDMTPRLLSTNCCWITVPEDTYNDHCRLREWSSTCAAIYQVSTCPPNCPILRTLLTCYLLWKVPSGTSARPLWSSTGPPSLMRWCMTSWAPSRWVSPLACGQLILCHAVGWLSLAFSQLTVFWVMQSADSLVIQVAYCILSHVISWLSLSCSQQTVFSVMQ